jgi:hypothetical protein
MHERRDLNGALLGLLQPLAFPQLGRRICLPIVDAFAPFMTTFHAT